MKAFTHKKTDKIDAEVIAKLVLNQMVQPSRVFLKNHREFRSFVRLRLAIVRKRKDIKNEAHAIFSSEMLHIGNVLKDIFGKNGRAILSGISSGDKLASWLGLVPNLYHSADKYHNGRITKRDPR